MRRLLPIIFCLSFGLAPLTHAAELYFGATAQEVAPGAIIEVAVFLNTDDGVVNAVEGTVSFSDDLLRLLEIRDAESAAALWIERPHATPEGIRFAGMIPGGYQGNRGRLFSLVLEATTEGKAEIRTFDEQALLNDGLGTAASVRRAPLKLTIRSGAAQPTIPRLEDAISPEDFTPMIASDPNIFEGRWFVSFFTQDKQSGLARYEVMERYSWWHWRSLTTPGVWQQSESPYVLKDQARAQDVSIKAIDRAGNERIAFVPASKHAAWYEVWLLWAILLLIAATAFLATSRAKRGYGGPRTHP